VTTGRAVGPKVGDPAGAVGCNVGGLVSIGLGVGKLVGAVVISGLRVGVLIGMAVMGVGPSAPFLLLPFLLLTFLLLLFLLFVPSPPFPLPPSPLPPSPLPPFPPFLDSFFEGSNGSVVYEMKGLKQ